METPLFFKSNNYKLFGVLHEPEPNKHDKLNEPNKPPMGLVFCHPFAEEKLISHRVMVNLARTLSKKEIYCLRFDYMGHGDSDGIFEDSTIESRLSDIQCAIDFLRMRTGVETVGLLGLRFGATLAALTCENMSTIDPLILIAPIVQGKAYIDQCLRSNLTMQMMVHNKIIKDRKTLVSDLLAGLTVNIDGYLLTKDLYKQIELINLMTTSASLQNILIIQVSRKENQPIGEEISALHMKYEAKSRRADLLSVKEEFFWTDTKMYSPQSRNIQEVVMNFLRRI